MSKRFLTYDEQLEKLVSEGLIVADAVNAKSCLRDIGYFSLVNGHKRLLQNSDSRAYRDGASFSDLLILYRFDNRLRELYFRSLLVVERKLCSALSYAFCFQYGENQAAYLDFANYNPSKRFERDVARLVSSLDRIANKDTVYPYIVHQRCCHGNVPLWVAANALTFGRISRMYSLLRPSTKAAVAKQFDHVNERQLEQMLKICVLFRNACAHGERLYDYRVRVDVPDMSLHKELGLPKRGDQYLQGKRDLFGVLISLRYLLPEGEFGSLFCGVNSLLENFVEECNVISEEEILGYMGFPFDWTSVRGAEI